MTRVVINNGISTVTKDLPKLTRQKGRYRTVSAANVIVRESDIGGTIGCDSAVPVTVTIPLGLAASIKDIIEIHQTGAGAVTIAGASGVTVQSRGAALTTAGQFAIAGIKQVAENVYRVTGDVTA